MSTNPNKVPKDLFDVFSSVEKPEPLTSKTGSQDDAEVDHFNRTDWDSATYDDASDGLEGLIICPPQTRVYLLPRLFRIVLLRLHGRSDGAVDNLSTYLETWPVDPSVERLLNPAQKTAIIRAWSYLDATHYAPGGSQVGRLLDEHWGLSDGAESKRI